MLEVASGEHGNQIEVLTTKSENGLSQDWVRTCRHTLQLQSIEHVGTFIKSFPNVIFHV